MTRDDQVLALIQRNVSEVSETYGLVNDLGAPNLAETPHDLHNRLLITRSAMTRVSELVGDLVRIRGRMQGVLIDRKGELETANSVAVAASSKRVLLEDYSSAQEKNSRLAAATLDERSRLRQVEKRMADLDAALEYGRTKHRELDRAVRDVELRVRILNFEPNSV